MDEYRSPPTATVVVTGPRPAPPTPRSSSPAMDHQRIVPQPTAFTVTFERDKRQEEVGSVKRHVRNLSLPIAKLYDNNKGGGAENVAVAAAVNGKSSRKAGNHSEGYFSSDPEEENAAELKPAGATAANARRKQSYEMCEGDECDMGGVRADADAEEEEEEDDEEEDEEEEEDDEEDDDGDEECGGSDVASETGTYTIDRENPEVITARLSIDANFGIHHDKKHNGSRETSSWVNEWATQLVNHKSASPTFSMNEHSKSSLTRTTQGATKIPSPLTTRARFGGKSSNRSKTEPAEQPPPSSPQPALKAPTPTISHSRQLARSKDDCSDSSLETESYLKTTEKVMSAIAARMSLSLDSGGESDLEAARPPNNGAAAASSAAAAANANNNSRHHHQNRNNHHHGHHHHLPAQQHHSDSSASESGAKTTTAANAPTTNTATARYNRAFSLRRGRLDDAGGKKGGLAGGADQPNNSAASRPVRRSESVTKATAAVAATATATTATTATTTAAAAAGLHHHPHPHHHPLPNTAAPRQKALSPLARTDTSRFTVKPKHSPQSAQLCLANNGVTAAKKKCGAGGGGGRSNSTLSSKEVEFQNWKRRKSYDPMKAAAEGKRKEAAAKKPPPNVMTQSSTNATTTPKSPVNSVLRSASFHGTRQLGGRSSSEDDEEITLSAEDEDWPVPTAPKTSLENSPRGSRVSLYSNNSNCSPRTRHKLEGVDNLVVSALYGMSAKLKVSAATLLKKLRYLYDEDSDKSKQLGVEIDQLEAVDQSGSPHKSPSKELTSTLRNLRRLDSTLKIIDQVLFEDEDFE